MGVDEGDGVDDEHLEAGRAQALVLTQLAFARRGTGALLFDENVALRQHHQHIGRVAAADPRDATQAAAELFDAARQGGMNITLAHGGRPESS